LGRAFNRMTQQVKAQRDALIEVNTETEKGRRLFDSVLSGVTAGVIGLDSDGRVEAINNAALEMLSLERGQVQDHPIADAVPEFVDLFQSLTHGRGNVSVSEIQLNRRGQAERLLARIASRYADDDLEGYVITFDDITELVSAQRMAAWGDVARRIAHEIKNPLTPIQLSAERIRRKFGDKVGDEKASLEQYADVIVRQTEDLRRIVDEFSRFARMPAAEMRRGDIMTVVRDAVVLSETANREIDYVKDLPDGPIELSFDATMMNQVFNNLLKNAAEAIESRLEKHPNTSIEPEIRVVIEAGETLTIVIQDNGIGLPAQRAQLFEPYVTHRDKGTGLGLSIVKKIVEEHGGRLELLDAPIFDGNSHFGAEARITFDLAGAKSTETNSTQRVA